MVTTPSSDLEHLHRLDLTQMSMTRGVSKRGTFGAVARMQDGEFPTFVLVKPCMIHDVTPDSHIVLHVTHAADCDALVALQNSFIVLLYSLVPMTEGFTCNDASAMVRRFVVPATNGDGFYLLVQMTQDDPDGVHRPTRVHTRSEEGDVVRDVGVSVLRAGMKIFPVFHVSGAALNDGSERLIAHVTVSDVMLASEDSETR